MPPVKAQFGMTKVIVSDIERAFTFYHSVFGLEESARVSKGEGESEMHEIIMGSERGKMSVPSLVVQSYPNKPLPPPGVVTLGFIVPDLEAAIDKAVNSGAIIKRPITSMPEHGIKVAFVSDPEGHLLEVVQML